MRAVSMGNPRTGKFGEVCRRTGMRKKKDERKNKAFPAMIRRI